MSAAKLIELEPGLEVFATSAMEARFLYEEIFRVGCYVIELPACPLVIDVGANIGMFVLFVKRSHPGARVMSFEPVPETASVLRRNLGLHRLEDVTVHEVALGSRPEHATPFTYYPALPGNSTRYPDQKGAVKAELGRRYSARVAERLYQGRDITVRVERLSAFLDTGRPVDLLKVDAEGAELEVLCGIEPGHWPLIRRAILEVHDHDDRLAAVCGLLRGHGLEPSVAPAPVSGADLRAYMVCAVRRPLCGYWPSARIQTTSR
jgi:FkbM family methyltransferase